MKVRKKKKDEVGKLKEGGNMIYLMNNGKNKDIVNKIVEKKINEFGME